MKKIICLAISVFFVFNITSLKGMKITAGDATKAMEKDKKERQKSKHTIEQKISKIEKQLKKANDKVEHYQNRVNKDENANNDVDEIVKQRHRDKLDNANWEQNELRGQLQRYTDRLKNQNSKNDKEVDDSYIDQPPYVPSPGIYQDNINMAGDSRNKPYLPSRTKKTEHHDITNQISKITDDWHQEEERFRIKNTKDNYFEFPEVEPIPIQDMKLSNNESSQIKRLRKAKRRNKNSQLEGKLKNNEKSQQQFKKISKQQIENYNYNYQFKKDYNPYNPPFAPPEDYGNQVNSAGIKHSEFPEVEPVPIQDMKLSNNESSQIERLREAKRRNKNSQLEGKLKNNEKNK